MIVTKNQISKTTVNTYYKRLFNEIDFDDENEEELKTFNKDDELSKKEQSNSNEIDNNDKDEKEQLVTRIR